MSRAPRYWCVYTPFGYNTRPAPGYPILQDRKRVADLALEANRSDPQWKGRGMQAAECTKDGRVLAFVQQPKPEPKPEALFCCDDGLGHSDGQGGPASCEPYCQCFRCAVVQAGLL